MKEVWLLAFCFLSLTFITNAQEVREEPEIWTVVEQVPEFPGGMKALFKYLSTNINYPKEAQTQGIEGRVVLKFIVLESGEITDVIVAKSIGGGCDEEAVRVVNEMPLWMLGIQKGVAVKVNYTLPIRFWLEKGKSNKNRK